RRAGAAEDNQVVSSRRPGRLDLEDEKGPPPVQPARLAGSRAPALERKPDARSQAQSPKHAFEAMVTPCLGSSESLPPPQLVRCATKPRACLPRRGPSWATYPPELFEAWKRGRPWLARSWTGRRRCAAWAVHPKPPTRRTRRFNWAVSSASRTPRSPDSAALSGEAIVGAT